MAKKSKKCKCTKPVPKGKIVDTQLAKLRLMKIKKDIENRHNEELKKAKLKAKKEIAELKKAYTFAEKQVKEHIHKDPEKAIKIATAVGAAIGFGIRHSLRRKRK